MVQAARPRPVAATSLAGTFSAALSAFRDLHFSLYWVSNALFFVGQGLVLLGAQWLMLSLNDSRTVLGAMGAIQALVVIALSPVAGVLADRLARRDILIVGRIGFAAVTATMGALVIADAAEVWIILLSVGISACFLAISQPASQSYVYDLVGRDRLYTALALNALATGVFQIAGPSVGGSLVSAIGSQATYLVGSAGYLVGAAFLFAIPVRGRTHTTGPRPRVSFTADFVEGLAHLKRDPLLFYVFMPATIVTMFAGAVLALRPVFAREVLDVGASGLGWLGAAFGVGALIGSIVVLGLGERLKWKGLTILVAPICWTGAMVVYAVSPWFPLTLGMEFVMGVTSPFWQTAIIMIFQVRVPEALRSRVLAMYFMVMQFMSLNWIFTGFLADAVGDRLALFVMGAIPTALLVLMLIFARPLVLLGSSKLPLVTWEPPAKEAKAG